MREYIGIVEIDTEVKKGEVVELLISYENDDNIETRSIRIGDVFFKRVFNFSEASFLLINIIGEEVE